MIPILLPSQRVTVAGEGVERVTVVVPFGCRPLRPLVPSIYAYYFDVVGIEKKAPTYEKSIKVWEDGQRAPAALFMEGFDSSFKLDLPSLFKGDELILIVENIEKGPRQFACGWLVEDERRS